MILDKFGFFSRRRRALFHASSLLPPLWGWGGGCTRARAHTHTHTHRERGQTIAGPFLVVENEVLHYSVGLHTHHDCVQAKPASSVSWTPHVGDKDRRYIKADSTIQTVLVVSHLGESMPLQRNGDRTRRGPCRLRDDG